MPYKKKESEVRTFTIPFVVEEENYNISVNYKKPSTLQSKSHCFCIYPIRNLMSDFENFEIR